MNGCGPVVFSIPQVSLLELIRLERDSEDKRIELVHGTPVYRRRGSLLPVAYLNDVLGLKSMERAEAVSMIVLQAEDRQFGLVVDGINDTQEIVVKPLGQQLKGLNEYAGATIMGDGRVALILDTLGIGQRSGVLSESRERARAGTEQKAKAADERQRLLLFRAGSFDRLAVPLSLVARLEELTQSSIERSGDARWQYRERILPLVPLQSVLEPEAPHPSQAADAVQVIVFNDGDRSLGLVVDQILDIAEEAVKENWFHGEGSKTSGRNILVAEASAFSRGVIRGSLDMAGYRVSEAASLEEAVRGLEQQPVDVVVAGLDLPLEGAAGLLAAMRGRPQWTGIPVLALADSMEQAQSPSVRKAGFQDCQTKFDREAVLESVARLVSSHEDTVCAGEER